MKLRTTTFWAAFGDPPLTSGRNSARASHNTFGGDCTDDFSRLMVNLEANQREMSVTNGPELPVQISQGNRPV